jgi:hypothetical protein
VRSTRALDGGRAGGVAVRVDTRLTGRFGVFPLVTGAQYRALLSL